MLVLLGIFFVLTRGDLAKAASSGIQNFYMLEIALGVTLQILLAIFDQQEAHRWVMSVRASAIVYLIGLAAVVTKLGLLGVWFIIIFCTALGMQLTMLFDIVSQVQDEDRYGQWKNENDVHERLVFAQNDAENQD